MEKYFTLYSHKDCVSLLKGKNIYDVFDYTIEFSADESTATVIFKKCNTHMCRSIRTAYLIRFISVNNGTCIEMEFQSELYIMQSPCIFEKWLDEFMEVKLSAKRVWKF